MAKQSQRTSLIRISKIEESQVEELVKQENSFRRLQISVLSLISILKID